MELATHEIKTIKNTDYIGTDKFVPIKTEDVISIFKGHGFTLEDYKEARIRKEEKRYKQRHLIRMSIDNDIEVRRDIIIFNAADGSTSLRLNFGLYRFYCENSMVIGDDLLPEMRIKHTKQDPFSLIDNYAKSVVNTLEEEQDLRRRMQSHRLSYYDIMSFAETALAIREKDMNIVLDISDVQRINRKEDNDKNLWIVFNRIQENLIHGNYRKQSIIHHDDGTNEIVYREARELKSPNELLRVNKELHNLATQFLK